MNHRSRRATAWILPTLALCLARSAEAHEQQVHADLIDMAFQTMLLAEHSPNLFTNPSPLPPGVTAADLQSLRQSMVLATTRWAGARVTLPPSGDRNHDRCQTAPDSWPILGAADQPLAIQYQEQEECLRPSWVPDGLFDPSNRLRFIGPVLGFLAAKADDEVDDTTLWIRPTAAGAFGVGPGPAIEAANDAVNLGLEVVLLPIVCVVDFIEGDFDCLNHASDLADAVNPIDDLAGAIPGISATDTQDDTLIGLWHHINVTPFRSNEYDDVQGYLLDEAGPAGFQDALETGLIIAGDVSGFSLDFDESAGPKQYQVVRSSDSHAVTRLRSKAQWQFHTVGHTAMEPLDNLAFFGWERFRAAPHDAAALEWPLHALGDAVSPMHVIGSPGWGHRPFEKSVQDDWRKIRYLDIADPVARVTEQENQVRRVFSAALRYRKLVTDWRRAHPAQARDVPVRDLITALAQETWNYSTLKMVTSAWPFSPTASTEDFLLGSSNFYERSDEADLVRPLIEAGVGASIAFLVSASEVL